MRNPRNTITQSAASANKRGTKVAAGLLTLVLGGGAFAATATGAGAVVDGQDATPGQVPHQVSLQVDEQHGCGGSIISPTIILTAAHCVEGDNTGLTIVAGINDLDETGQRRTVTRIVPHPEYGGDIAADIAVLELDRPLEMNDQVQAIALASASDLASARNATVSGWGALGENIYEDPTTMQVATVPMVNDAACDVGIDAAHETCAGGTGTDSCYGDSGGPLTIDMRNGRAIAGVVSWGTECGGTDPGVYAEVPAFAEFIAQASDGTIAGFDPGTVLPSADDTEGEDDWEAEETDGPEVDLELDDLDLGGDTDLEDDTDWDDTDWDHDYDFDAEYDDADWDDSDWDDDFEDDADWDFEDDDDEFGHCE